MSATSTLTPAEELERATSDYLSVSRNAGLYASPAEHQTAEERAWSRLMEARSAVEALADAE